MAFAMADMKFAMGDMTIHHEVNYFRRIQAVGKKHNMKTVFSKLQNTPQNRRPYRARLPFGGT